MDEYLDAIRHRRDEIMARVDEALERSGRAPGSVRVMAVSKTVGTPQVLAAIEAGYGLFGENRPQELVRKLGELAEVSDLPPVRFDMIGNLQTNKINAVLGRAACIHSVSSLHLAEAISSRVQRRIESGELAAAQPVLLEANVSGELSKSGFTPDELRAAFPRLSELRGILIQGLMTMAPRGDKSVARSTFASLRELRDELAGDWPGVDLAELSCGMSEDFSEAILEGSTLVRLGRVVFDPAFELE
ncbi:YggS family pyridoxal phosphate-dependent enzyme [uncultured Enorma sp.]|uniref:YggS family pyridoxal phosphate-dependent enzyme n=1 Tax=uncultured Enorma sp. TaxID=1714346 RepID=UPI002603F4C7|nr:YggS family pyridoxal phosphate-dependent enzyme [uncultured Enorma sp.]